jgi:predicted nucleotidyltransferase
MPQLNFSQLQLEPRHLQLLQSLLARYVPQAEVWAYGSRVSGNAHQGSDLDIVVRQPSDLMQVQPDLAELKEAVQASTLPILIDIHDWAQLPASFHTNIAAAFVVLQQPNQNI